MKKTLTVAVLLSVVVCLGITSSAQAAAPVIKNVRVWCDFDGITSMGKYCTVRAKVNNATAVRIAVNGEGYRRAVRDSSSAFGKGYQWRMPNTDVGKFKGKDRVPVNVIANGDDQKDQGSFFAKVYGIR